MKTEHRNPASYGKQVGEALDFLKRYTETMPSHLLMAGTGLGDCAGRLDHIVRIQYTDIPYFPKSTVTSHAGHILFGSLYGTPMAVMMGRFHLYEGYSSKQVTFPIRVLRAMGAHTLIVSNASGGLDPAFSPGDIMVIRDHINLTNENPLAGPNNDGWGLRFPDMIGAYDPALAKKALAAGRCLGIPVVEGVYAGLKGPSLETPAEMRFLQIIGAHAVGFSTVQEVIAARHGGMRILGLSVITNRCDPDHPEPATVEQVIDVAGKAAPRLTRLIEQIIT